MNLSIENISKLIVDIGLNITRSPDDPAKIYIGTAKIGRKLFSDFSDGITTILERDLEFRKKKVEELKALLAKEEAAASIIKNTLETDEISE